MAGAESRLWPKWLERTDSRVRVLCLDGLEDEDEVTGIVRFGDTTELGITLTLEGSKRERFIPWTAVRWVDQYVGRAAK